MLSEEAPKRFARQAMQYVTAVCDRLHLTPTRIGIDAPSAPCNPEIPRRAAEVALDRAGISCFATPSARDFETIRDKVIRHLAAGGREDRIPHANQLWMLAGFAIFEELSRVTQCLEVFPQATVRAVGRGQVHKSQSGAVEDQLAAAARYAGWPLGLEGEPALHEIAWGAPHDQLDAYLSAWVAGLEEPDRTAYGVPPGDEIWIPKVLTAHEAPIPVQVPPGVRQPDRPSRAVLCPGCGQKEFKRWPWGWDAHAAHTCDGLIATEPEERKSEYRRRFAEHF